MLPHAHRFSRSRRATLFNVASRKFAAYFWVVVLSEAKDLGIAKSDT